MVSKVVPVAAGTVLMLMAGCGRPDGQALQRLACQQVANSIDLQSVSQLDALRKALGVAPGVDPLETCRVLGVTMEPNPQAVQAAQDDNREGEGDGQRDPSEGGQDGGERSEN